MTLTSNGGERSTTVPERGGLFSGCFAVVRHDPPLLVFLLIDALRVTVRTRYAIR
jgi:hypothetical protein